MKFWVFAIALVGAMILYLLWLTQHLEKPVVFEVAQIESIVSGGKGVIVKTNEGRKVLVLGGPSDLAGCLQGEKIRLERRGDAYSVAINGCRLPRVKQ